MTWDHSSARRERLKTYARDLFLPPTIVASQNLNCSSNGEHAVEFELENLGDTFIVTTGSQSSN